MAKQKLKIGQQYFFVSIKPHLIMKSWDNSPEDKKRLKEGNVFVGLESEKLDNVLSQLNKP